MLRSVCEEFEWRAITWDDNWWYIDDNCMFGTSDFPVCFCWDSATPSKCLGKQDDLAKHFVFGKTCYFWIFQVPGFQDFPESGSFDLFFDRRWKVPFETPLKRHQKIAPQNEVGEPSWPVATHSGFLPNGQHDLCIAQERYSHRGWQVSHHWGCESTKTSCSDVLLEVKKPWLRKELFVEYSQEVLSTVNPNFAK